MLNKLGLGLPRSKMFVSGASFFKDATFAYSLIDLGLGATNVVKVRRDSDGVEQDFTAEQITDGSLDAFLGGSTNSAVRLINQNGGVDASQNTGSRQPTIDNGDLRYFDDWLEIPNNNDLIFNDGTNNVDFTILTEVIFDSFNTGNRAFLVSKRTASTGTSSEWQFRYLSGTIGLSVVGSTNQLVTFPLSITFGQKYIFAVTLVGNDLNLYVDGVLVNTTNIGNFQFKANGTSPVQLGNATYLTVRDLRGRQNTTAIWKGKGLTPAEITEATNFLI